MQKSILVVIVLLLFGVMCFSTVISIPPKEQQIVGNWVGFTPSANDFYRISLGDHDGFIGCSFVGEKAKLYRIDSWNLDSKGRFTIKASGISENAYPIVIEGHAMISRLELKIMGPAKEKGWEIDVTLYREELIESRTLTLKKSMEGLK